MGTKARAPIGLVVSSFADSGEQGTRSDGDAPARRWRRCRRQTRVCRRYGPAGRGQRRRGNKAGIVSRLSARDASRRLHNAPVTWGPTVPGPTSAAARRRRTARLWRPALCCCCLSASADAATHGGGPPARRGTRRDGKARLGTGFGCGSGAGRTWRGATLDATWACARRVYGFAIAHSMCVHLTARRPSSPPPPLAPPTPPSESGCRSRTRSAC